MCIECNDAAFYQLMLNIRPSRLFIHKMCVHVRSFSSDIDFHYCFHCCWLRICDTLLLLFFLVCFVQWCWCIQNIKQCGICLVRIYMIIAVSIHIDPATYLYDVKWANNSSIFNVHSLNWLSSTLSNSQRNVDKCTG